MNAACDIAARIFLRLAEAGVKLLCGEQYYLKSYSQEGEDMILRRIFEGKVDGFYVDVGAHHPKRFSNTYFFYLLGWRGINIDATPGSMMAFRKLRRRDINVETAISKDKKELTFFMFNEPALNTFDEKTRQDHTSDKYVVVREQQVQTRTLHEVLRSHIPPNTRIDFMSVDVEGLDLEVLQSNDWQIFRPEYVLVESFGVELENLKNSEVYQFLDREGYDFFAKTFYTLIFKERKA